MKENKTIAIVLAAGNGKRMNSKVAKQYMNINGKPVLYYSLKAFEESDIDEVILVVAEGDIEYCKNDIVLKYGFCKVTKVIKGGSERYDSVYQGLIQANLAEYVLIHDGARPMITPDMIHEVIEEVKKKKACIVGVRAKDTIKIVNSKLQVIETPDRQSIWNIQTPQAFEYKLIKKAYEMLMEETNIQVTDDAMVVETMLKCPVYLVEGTYMNIKITTPEDIKIAETHLLEGYDNNV